MSRIGSILDALEGIVRASQAALPGGLKALPAGTDGWEREVLRPGQDLDVTRAPHVFAHDPTEVRTELEHQGAALEGSVQLSMWTHGETQEQLLTRLEAAHAAIDGDRSLGGLVERAHVATIAVRDLGAQSPHRVGFLIVSYRGSEL